MKAKKTYKQKVTKASKRTMGKATGGAQEIVAEGCQIQGIGKDQEKHDALLGTLSDAGSVDTVGKATKYGE